ncbi:MAG: SDR family NAD(P)-dependent oxidoreductase [Candidatus Methylacidiphilales bacterium]
MTAERPVWLDGASGTLGRAVLSRLHTQQRRVLALYRKSPPFEVHWPHEILPSQPQDWPDKAEAWFQNYGAPSSLICMSGRTLNRLALKTSEQETFELFEANFNHPRRLITACLPWMMRAGGGSIIVCSSHAAQHPRTGQSAYAATKGALESWIRGLAKELGSKNIRVNAIAPGFIESPMWRELSPQHQAHILESIALGRTGTPDEVAAVVDFLSSPHSTYITGQIIRVAGG